MLVKEPTEVPDIREDPIRGIIVSGVEEIKVNSTSEVLNLIK